MSSLGYLPITLVILAFATFIATYIIAVVRGDVSAAFPYISDTGAEIPESCIFGQFLNLTACLAFCTMYIRYKSIQSIAGDEDVWLRRMNKISFIMGIISAIGVSMVANFQRTEVEPVHFTGAALTFILGLLYTFVQTGISYHMYPDYSGIYICRVRLAVCLTSLASFIIIYLAAAAAGYAVYEWNRHTHDESKFKWKPDDPGYAAHVVSTAGEWMTAITFMCYFFTYVREFFKFELNIAMRPLVRHLDEEPYYYDRESSDERTRLLA
ncbi:hypothetical protein SNE40_001682 [Patella caerulea]|uniref:CWH43-like N-terminal domain-containing protein n=1 Tax=Patella caerulea TaxID=87958 RepID=A0AAN8PZ43_PATCE